MIMRHLWLVAALWPGLALADSLPAAFEVRDVAQNDVLNIRAAPSPEAEVLGEIGPYGINIEVLETTADGTWGKVGVPEGNGWVAMRYLAPMPATDPYTVPRPISCFGTEPFWTVSLYPRGAEFNSPETGAIPMTVVAEATSPQGYYFQLEEGPTLNRTLIVTRQKCTDGMSDREFGFSTMMFQEAPDGNVTVSGCCTLDHR